MTAVTANGSFRLGDILERALNQGLQTAIGTLPTVLGVIGTSGVLATTGTAADTGKAAVAAGVTATIATLLSIVKNLVVTAKPVSASANLVQRLAWTFTFAAVAALPTGTIYLDLAFGKAAVLAAVSAGLAAVVSMAKNLTAEGVLVQASVRAGRGGASTVP